MDIFPHTHVLNLIICGSRCADFNSLPNLDTRMHTICTHPEVLRGCNNDGVVKPYSVLIKSL